jgi:uncharacterized zinc-type alcohol dehydrogenase-like protein
MSTAVGYGAQSATSPLAQLSFERREPGPTDVAIDILYCGVCHSDLHWVRNEWGMSMYPVVPGHEIVGRVTRVGNGVTGLAAGDIVGVGCLVGSCRTCPQCADGLEQYCPGMVLTYGSPDKQLGGVTQGGYSTAIVVDQTFVLRVPARLDTAGAAPLLCAGITTYSPLRHWNVGRGSKLGVVGLGGLGHMGLKFGRALGAEVVLFTTSPGKATDAKRLGADAVVVSNDAEAMKAHANSFNLILDTVSAPHDLDALTSLR